jgi:hypothetical protein
MGVNVGGRVVARFLQDFSRGAAGLWLVLVDFAAGECPSCARVPAADEEDAGEAGVEDDGAADGDADLVPDEFPEGVFCGLRGGDALEEGHVVEEEVGELAEGEAGERGADGPDVVLVEPVRLLDLEADAGDGRCFLAGDVEDEAAAGGQ